MIKSGAALDRDGRVAVDFARRHPGTLIVVQGDHETGGLTIENPDPEDESGDELSREDGPFPVRARTCRSSPTGPPPAHRRRHPDHGQRPRLGGLRRRHRQHRRPRRHRAGDARRIEPAAHAGPPSRPPRTGTRTGARSGVGDEDLLLELDAFVAALLADVALDAERHAGLDHPVVARVLEVQVVVQVRVLAGHAAPVRRDEVAVGDEALRDLPRLPRVLPERHARARKSPCCGAPARERCRYSSRLRRVGASGPGVEGAREVAVVAVAADDVGVERDELARLEAALARSPGTRGSSAVPSSAGASRRSRRRAR